jgi:hypothetical protein
MSDVRINIPVREENHKILREIKFITNKSFNKIIDEILTEHLPMYLKKVKEVRT